MIIDCLWNRIDIIKDVINTGLVFKLITVFYFIFNISIVDVGDFRYWMTHLETLENIRWITIMGG